MTNDWNSLSPTIRADWDAFVRDTLSPESLITYHRRIPGERGLCFGCLECGKSARWPCDTRRRADVQYFKDHPGSGFP